MTFNQINYFLEVAAQLNFTKAAAALFVTQSTLSRSIAALESEIGATLLKRDFHTVSLTPAGEILYKEMKPIMQSINAVVVRTQAAADEVVDKFVLGILEGQSVDADILFAIRNLSEKFPHLGVDIRRTGHAKLIEDLLSCQLNAVQTVISEDTVLEDCLEYLPFCELNNYLLAQKKDSVLNAPFSLRSLEGRALIVPNDMHPGLLAALRAIRDAGISVKVKKAPDLETQSLWMEAGMGVYIGNDNSVIYTSRSFRPIGAVHMDGLPKSQEVLIWNRNCFPLILGDFLSFIRMHMNERADSDVVAPH